MISLKSNRDSAASAADNDLIGIYQAVDGILLHNLYRLRRSHYTAVTAACILFCDIAVGFFRVFRLFSGHKMSDRLAGILESRIVRIYPHLSYNSNDRSTHKASFAKLLSERVLKIIPDISLAHCDTYRKRCVGLAGVFPGKSGHGIVDHAYLGTVSVDHNHLVSVLDQVAESFCCCFYSHHLFRQSISKSIAPQSNDNTFPFIHVKTS